MARFGEVRFFLDRQLEHAAADTPDRPRDSQSRRLTEHLATNKRIDDCHEAAHVANDTVVLGRS
jgi:hypothetical protein